MPRIGSKRAISPSGVEYSQYFVEQDGNPIEISAQEYANIDKANNTGPVQAGLMSMGERVLNLINKFPGGDMLQPDVPEGGMEAIKREHPLASTVGTTGAYLAATPAAAMSGPLAAGVGALTGYGLADEEDKWRDGTVGGAAGGLAGAFNAANNLRKASKLSKEGKKWFDAQVKKVPGDISNYKEVVDNIRANADSLFGVAKKKATGTPTLGKDLNTGARLSTPGLLDSVDEYTSPIQQVD